MRVNSSSIHTDSTVFEAPRLYLAIIQEVVHRAIFVTELVEASARRTVSSFSKELADNNRLRSTILSVHCLLPLLQYAYMRGRYCVGPLATNLAVACRVPEERVVKDSNEAHSKTETPPRS